MDIIKPYKYKLRLTNAQEKRLANWIGTCRYIYNVALETKIESYRINKTNLSCFDLIKQTAGVRGEFSWVKDVPY